MPEVLADDADAVRVLAEIDLGGEVPKLMSGDPAADMPPGPPGDQLRQESPIDVAAAGGEEPRHARAGPERLPSREVLLDQLRQLRRQREPERLAVLDLLRGQLDHPAGIVILTEPANGLADAQVDQVPAPHAADQQELDRHGVPGAARGVLPVAGLPRSLDEPMGQGDQPIGEGGIVQLLEQSAVLGREAATRRGASPDRSQHFVELGDLRLRKTGVEGGGAGAPGNIVDRRRDAVATPAIEKLERLLERVGRTSVATEVELFDRLARRDQGRGDRDEGAAELFDRRLGVAVAARVQKRVGVRQAFEVLLDVLLEGDRQLLARVASTTFACVAAARGAAGAILAPCRRRGSRRGGSP